MASGDITERAQKSTLLPIKFYLNLPSFPFNRALILLSGWVDFIFILPAFSESIIFATSLINSGANLIRSASLLQLAISPFFCRIDLYIYVYWSYAILAGFISMAGLTYGGITNKYLMIRSFGLESLVKPSTVASSSRILRKISRHLSAVISLADSFWDDYILIYPFRA